jgi:transposase
MDNLPAHKVQGVRQSIESAGAELRSLPPYSSDLNPIEMAFSQLKAHLRKAAEKTIPALWGPHRPMSRQNHPKSLRKLFRRSRICTMLGGERSKWAIVCTMENPSEPR